MNRNAFHLTPEQHAAHLADPDCPPVEWALEHHPAVDEETAALAFALALEAAEAAESLTLAYTAPAKRRRQSRAARRRVAACNRRPVGDRRVRREIRRGIAHGVRCPETLRDRVAHAVGTAWHGFVIPSPDRVSRLIRAELDAAASPVTVEG